MGRFPGAADVHDQQEGKYQFLLDLSRNSVRGKIAKAASGHHAGGPAPWGYDRMLCDETGAHRQRVRSGEKVAKPKGWTTTLVLSDDKELVELIQGIFRRYASSAISMSGLVGELNARGKFGPGGLHWTRQQVRLMLMNQVYCGDLVWNRSRIGKYHVTMKGEVVAKAKALAGGDISPNQQRTKTAREDWIVHQDRFPALIERKIWEKVQKKIAKRSTGGAVRTGGYLLSGVLYCGHCGAKLGGYVQKRKHRDPLKPDYVYRWYSCPRYAETSGHACNGAHNAVDADALERFVVEAIRDAVLQPELIERLKAEIRRQLKTRSHAPAADAGRLKQQLAELDRKIERGTENLLLAESENLAAAQAMLTKWRQERAALDQERRAQGKGAKRPEQDIDDLADRALDELVRLSKGLGDDDPAIVKEVIGQLVERVEVWFDVRQQKRQKWSYFSRELLVLRLPSFFWELSTLSSYDHHKPPATAPPDLRRWRAFGPTGVQRAWISYCFTALECGLFNRQTGLILFCMADHLQDLRVKLAELQTKLSATGTLDPADRALMEEVVADIELVLAEQASGAAPGESARAPGSLVERLATTARNFEDTHPTLFGAVGSVIDALSRMGI